MASLETIRRVTIRADQEGIPETTAALNKLADAQGNIAVVSERSEKSTLSASKQYENLQRSLDLGYRSSQQFEKAQSDLDRARAQGLVSGDRYNELLGLARDRFNQGSAASVAFRNALSGVQGQIVGLAAGMGPVGVFLAGLGPWGLAAGAGLGLAAAAINHMVEEANRMGELAQRTKEFSQAVGLSATTAQALQHAGSDVGLSADQVQSGMERLTISVEQLRLGQGNLLAQVTRLNPALADQLARTRDTTSAVDLLAKAWENADVAQRNALARAVAGRTGIDFGRLLGQVSEAGGVDALTAAQQKNIVLTNQQIESFAKLKIQVDEAERHAKDLMGSLWTEDVLTRQLQAAQIMERIAIAAKQIAEESSKKTFMQNVGDYFTSFFSPNGRPGSAIPTAPSLPVPRDGTLTGDFLSPDRTKSTPQSAPTAGFIYADLQRRNSILGAAATSTDLLNLKQAQLNKEIEDAGGKYGNLATRAMDAYKVQLAGADLQIRVQNGAATATDLYSQKQRELNLLVVQQKLTQDQANASLEVYGRKTIPDVIAQMEVMKSSLPGLKALELDSVRLDKQFDSFATGSLNSVTNDLVDLGTGATTAGAAFSNMSLHIVQALERMLIQMVIIAPIAKALQGLFNFGVTTTGGGSGFGQDVGSIGGGATGVAGVNLGSAQGHTGGIFGESAMPTRYVHPAYFDDAPRYHNGIDFAGGEMPAVVKRGEEIGWPQQLAQKYGGGGSNVQVNVINNHPSAQVEERKSNEGGVDIHDFIISTVNESIVGGRADSSTAARTGVRPRVRPRG